ncbi:MAG: DUF1697 domain-containing protein [Actinobacteria bacterium]|nr:DUF1697 domain-containing protein [Actinomycetota bacterium]
MKPPPRWVQGDTVPPPMTKYAAFLRAVNLGPRRRVSSAELRRIFEDLGFGDVATFRTSGNVAFSAGREPAAMLTTRIEEGLAESLGYEVPTFLRTAYEMRALAEHQPFDPELLRTSRGKLQVSLLSDRPAKGAEAAVLALATDQDRLALGDRELYWLPSGGILDSRLDQKAIATLLGPSTMRTKGTVEQLAAKYFMG